MNRLNSKTRAPTCRAATLSFEQKEKISPALAKKIQTPIEREFGCDPEIILRTRDELRKAIAATPFASRRDLDPGKILVTFLTAEPPPYSA